MKPNQGGETLEMLGMIDIQAATLFHVVIQFTRAVEDISGGLVKGLGLLSLSRSQEKEVENNEKVGSHGRGRQIIPPPPAGARGGFISELAY